MPGLHGLSRLVDDHRLAIVMVGLPARGKTYTARKLARYLNWHGVNAKVFNVGNYRRERLGAHQDHRFFDPDNPDGVESRQRVAMSALSDMLAWLTSAGDVGIYDATNSTKVRRDTVLQTAQRAGVKVLFVEVVCTDPAVVEANVRETKLSSPDYANSDPTEAIDDFLARIQHYERAYEPMEDASLSYVKLIDAGRQLRVNRVSGFLPSRLVTFLMNLRPFPRPIWLTRHGESQFNQLGLLGGDASLSKKGRVYAAALAEFINERDSPDDPLVVWTSTLRRTVETAKPMSRPTFAWRALDEINAGVCEEMTYAEIAKKMPTEFTARRTDKLRYRYPRGESYEDVIERLDPVIIELEHRRSPILVVAHQAVLRALYGFFSEHERAAVPPLDIPLHPVIELVPKAYGAVERRFELAPGVIRSSSS